MMQCSAVQYKTTASGLHTLRGAVCEKYHITWINEKALEIICPNGFHTGEMLDISNVSFNLIMKDNYSSET